MTFFKKMNQSGVLHWSMVAPVLVVLIIAAIGTKVLTTSHAASLNSASSHFSGTVTKDGCINSRLPIGDVGCSLTIGNKTVQIAHGNKSTATWGKLYGFTAVTDITGGRVLVEATPTSQANVYGLGSNSSYVRLLSSPPATTVTATDADNGKNITLSKGQTLIVQLNTVFWTINDSSNKSIVKMIGQPVKQPSANGGPAGSGSGTTTAHFTAVASGSATITASRSSCGEASTCTGNLGSYKLIVTVR